VKGPQEAFGPVDLAAEINRRFAGRLGWKVDARQVSVVLRWMAGTGRVVRTGRGRQKRQSKYVRAGG
jgi:hypothetical protein